MLSWEQIKQRKLVQWAVGYSAAAWAVLQLLDMLSSRFDWPPAIMRGALVLFGFGLLATIVLAWFHGERGHQRARTSEIVLLSAITLSAIAAVAFFARGNTPVAASSPKEEVATEAGSIAVLPFVDMSAAKDQEYFTDGMTEEILNSLAQVAGLRVAARTSTFAFKGKDVPIDSIGRQLRVHDVVEGSVRKAGDKVRITAKLIDAHSGYELWGESFDRQLTDVFAIEKEIAVAVANALKVRLAHSAPVTKEPSTAAHDLYLRGRFAFNKQTEQSLREAISYYQQALAIQPDYALAHVGIADAVIWMADSFLPPREAYPRGKREALAALAIDSTLVDARARLAEIETIYDWDPVQAQRDFQRVLDAGPPSPDNLFYTGTYYTIYGQIGEAVEKVKKARDLDPLNPVLNGTLAVCRYWARDYDGALRDFDATEQIDPNYIWLGGTRGDVYREKKMYKEALATYAREEKLTGMPSAGLGVTYARLGRKADALRIAHELEALSRSRYVAADRIAAIYANLGDIDRAYDILLGPGMKMRDTWMAWIPIMPEFDPIRSDPRYRKLLKLMNL